ncbi:Calcineurin-like phosphoesterase domain, ApaH type [Dillenia turbinata]|uniref:Purple acid phosphatase n=1 Tax=Dillenia turbinata TaxID=194707 RepID=A0AAN8VI05_9MAGN
MEIKRLVIGIAILVISATVRADYVRPKPRKTLHFPWDSKPASHPQQVHISLAGDKHMRISWITVDEDSASIVDYGTLSRNYMATAQGESTSYSYLFYNSGKIHHTVIGPLEDDTVYFYRCGGGGPEFQLKTPPSKFPITFAVAADLGQTGWTQSTLDHIGQCKYDVHLLPGDLSYADYMQHRWDTFGELVQPLASARPWMVTEGNHEEESIPVFMDGFLSYNSRWKMPYEESGSTSNLYYSFEVAGVHVIMLGSYAEYDESSEQYSWLQKRIYNGHSDSCGAVHITIGDGGNREGLAHRYKDPQPDWSVFREASFGHGELKIVNSTHAFWGWHRNDDDEPIRSDQVWITSLADSECLAGKSYELRKRLMSP